jgi:hypothetical protein
MRRKRRIGILVLDGVKLLDVAGRAKFSARLTASAPITRLRRTQRTAVTWPRRPGCESAWTPPQTPGRWRSHWWPAETSFRSVPAGRQPTKPASRVLECPLAAMCPGRAREILDKTQAFTAEVAR